MSGFDQGIERNKKLSMKEKVLVTCALVAIFASLMVPVSQSARNHELTIRLSHLESESDLIEEQQRVLSARIAESKLPEQTLRQAVLQGLSLEKIVFEDTKIVRIGE